MSPEIIGIIGVIALIVMIGLRIWIGAALAVVGFVGTLVLNGWLAAMGVAVNAPFSQLDSYTTTAIPMFTLMGMIIAETDIGKNLFDFANKFLGRRRGGVASATVVASGFMGAITGSDNVACVIMSKLAIPELKRLNYADSLATSAVAAASPLALLIPPSMPMIMYAMLMEQSVGTLFISGIGPGILMTIAFVIAITITCIRKPHLGPMGEVFTRKEKLRSLWGVVPIIILFLIVLGGIYFGICTPTEAGALGSIGAFIIAIICGQITFKKLNRILLETVLAVGFVMFMLVGTFVFIRFITLSRLPFMITNFIVSLSMPPFVILFFVAVMYVILGMMMPQIPMMILTVPLITPAMMALGYDVIWFAVFVVMMMALGAISPPIAMNCFLVSGLSGVPVSTVFRGVWPFIIANLVVIFLVCLIPQIALWLPSLM